MSLYKYLSAWDLHKYIDIFRYVFFTDKFNLKLATESCFEAAAQLIIRLAKLVITGGGVCLG